MEVIQQDRFSVIRIANSFKNSNTYIIRPDGCNSVWLVDIGDTQSVLSVIGDKSIAGIFLTHAHLDHIYGIKKVMESFAGCVVYGSAQCLEYLLDDRKNLSFYYERPLSLEIVNSQVLHDNGMARLTDGIMVESFLTPGHTPDSTCYQVDNLIFTGDAYIPGIQTVTKLRGGNKQLASESIGRIKSRTDSSTIILPGHGKVTHNIE